MKHRIIHRTFEAVTARLVTLSLCVAAALAPTLALADDWPQWRGPQRTGLSEEKGLLDKTLLVVSTEFGRPAQFDGRGGRGHHSKSFSVVLAGGGLNTGQAIGTTDELGMNIVERPVSVPDLFATILATLGIDYSEQLYAGSRPVPVTDMGQPITELFA